MAHYNKDSFVRFMDAIGKTGDIALAYAFQKDMMRQEFLERQERERLIEEIAERVLSRISITVDAQEIFDSIDDLNNRINALGQ